MHIHKKRHRGLCLWNHLPYKALSASQFKSNAWVKFFRIIPEFRILRLTFYRKSAPESCIRQITGIFSGLFTVNLKTFDHSNLKLLMIYGHTTSFKIRISEVHDFGNFELSPMVMSHSTMKHIFCNSLLHSNLLQSAL